MEIYLYRNQGSQNSFNTKIKPAKAGFFTGISLRFLQKKPGEPGKVLGHNKERNG